MLVLGVCLPTTAVGNAPFCGHPCTNMESFGGVEGSLPHFGFELLYFLFSILVYSASPVSCVWPSTFLLEQR